MMSSFARRVSGVLAARVLCGLGLVGAGSSHKKTTVVSIAVTPTAPSIKVGATQQFTATATNKNGTQTDITSQVTWKSATAGVATISATGLATGVTAGSSGITAAPGPLVSAPPVPLTV